MPAAPVVFMFNLSECGFHGFLNGLAAVLAVYYKTQCKFVLYKKSKLSFKVGMTVIKSNKTRVGM